MEPLIAITPIQRPQPRRLCIAKPRDREPGPLRTEVRPPWRPTLHNRQMPPGDIDLDPNLVPDMLRNPSTTPPLHPNNIGLRQDSHLASLSPNRSTCCDVHLNLPQHSGAKSTCHSQITRCRTARAVGPPLPQHLCRHRREFRSLPWCLVRCSPDLNQRTGPGTVRPDDRSRSDQTVVSRSSDSEHRFGNACEPFM